MSVKMAGDLGKGDTYVIPETGQARKIRRVEWDSGGVTLHSVPADGSNARVMTDTYPAADELETR